MRIPRHTGRTLSGLDVTVPDDFTGERNAVVIAFERHHLVVCRSWRAALRDAYAADESLGFYAIAVIGEAGFFHQRIVSWALQFEITDDFSREHTALIATDRRLWLHQSGLHDMSTPILAICDQSGEIHTTARAFPEPASVPQVLRALLG